MGATQPPEILGLLSDPLRWQLVVELGRSDRRVGELVQLVGKPQNLVSYHLAELRRAACVDARRSSADGRDIYYRADLFVVGTCSATPVARSIPASRSRPLPQTTSRRDGPDRDCCSCAPATAPAPRSPKRSSSERPADAVEAAQRRQPSQAAAPERGAGRCAERGIDIAVGRTKHLDGSPAQRFDCVITLCDQVREVCPEFPGAPTVVHWSIADPALGGDRRRATYPAFERVADEIDDALEFLLPLDSTNHRNRGGRHMPTTDEMVHVRYMVDDVDAAIDFYTEHLGFRCSTSAAPAFADVLRGNLRLLLCGPASSAGRPMPDGAKPVPGRVEPHPPPRRGPRRGG